MAVAAAKAGFWVIGAGHIMPAGAASCALSVRATYIGDMGSKLLTLLFTLAAGGAHAQCLAGGPPGAVVTSCPGGVGVLSTDRFGNTSGMIGGQPFVGRQVIPGVITGTLGGAPYTVQGGVAPTPPNFIPQPTPDLTSPGLAPVPALQLGTPAPRPFAGDAASRAATRRRMEYLRRQREAEAASKPRGSATVP